MTIIASSSPTTAQTSAPSIRSTRWSDHFGPYSGGVLLVQLPCFFGFLLNAGTPPALLITSPASGLRRAQSMNFWHRRARAASVGRTMKR